MSDDDSLSGQLSKRVTELTERASRAMERAEAQPAGSVGRVMGLAVFDALMDEIDAILEGRFIVVVRDDES